VISASAHGQIQAVDPEKTRKPMRNSRVADAFGTWRSMLSIVKTRKDAKGILRQWVEMTALWALHGIGPNYYQLAGFWRRGEPWQRMTRHLSVDAYNRLVAALNPPSYRKLSQNKIAEKALLTLLGVPTPRFLGMLDTTDGRDASGAPLRTADDLERMLTSRAGGRVCFKLVEGHGGAGFAAVDIVRDVDRDGVAFRLVGPSSQLSSNGRLLSPAELLAYLGNRPRIVESFIDQHPAYRAFNSTSVNTLRIWVLRQDDRSSVRLAYLRIGRAGSLVDNHAAGGIVAPVDLDTGVLGSGATGIPRTTPSRCIPIMARKSRASCSSASPRPRRWRSNVWSRSRR
jgi:hypothetical protein